MRIFSFFLPIERMTNLFKFNDFYPITNRVAVRQQMFVCFLFALTSIGFLRNFVIRLDCTLIGRCRWKLEVGGIREHNAITFEEFFNFSVTVAVTAVPQRAEDLLCRL